MVGIHASGISIPLSLLMLLWWRRIWIAFLTRRVCQCGSLSMHLTSFPLGAMSGRIGVFRYRRGLTAREAYVSLVLLHPLLHWSSCLPDVYSVARDPVYHPISSSGRDWAVPGGCVELCWTWRLSVCRVVRGSAGVSVKPSLRRRVPPWLCGSPVCSPDEDQQLAVKTSRSLLRLHSWDKRASVSFKSPINFKLYGHFTILYSGGLAIQTAVGCDLWTDESFTLVLHQIHVIRQAKNLDEKFHPSWMGFISGFQNAYKLWRPLLYGAGAMNPKLILVGLFGVAPWTAPRYVVWRGSCWTMNQTWWSRIRVYQLDL